MEAESNSFTESKSQLLVLPLHLNKLFLYDYS